MFHSFEQLLSMGRCSGKGHQQASTAHIWLFSSLHAAQKTKEKWAFPSCPLCSLRMRSLGSALPGVVAAFLCPERSISSLLLSEYVHLVE